MSDSKDTKRKGQLPARRKEKHSALTGKSENIAKFTLSDVLIDHFSFEIENRMYKATEKLIKCFIRLRRKWQLARSFSPEEAGTA